MGESFESDELTLASQYIKDDSIILDIGANIGLHSLSFSMMAKNGLVIACEPQPITFRTLEKNISQNNIKNIIPLNLAIAKAPKIAEFYVMKDDAYSSLIDTSRKELSEKINVLCTSVDGVFGDIRFDFVKIDVEGLEFNVLESMCNLIQRHHPVIFCEIYKGKIYSNNPHDTILFLRHFGYQVYRVIDGALLEFGISDTHTDQYYNYFFVHNGK
jgi:FkbM family methyltransferase